MVLDFRRFADILGTNIADDLSKLSKTLEETQQEIDEGRYGTHINNMNKELRNQLDNHLYQYILKRFEEISGIPLSESWAIKKRHLAAKAAGLEAKDLNLASVLKHKSKGGAGSVRTRDANTSGSVKNYKLRVTDMLYKPIKPENVPKFGQATGFLKDTILMALHAHSNQGSALRSTIENIRTDNGNRYYYTVELDHKFFYKEYPKYLELILASHGMGTLLIDLNSASAMGFRNAALETFHEIISSAANLALNR